MESQSIPQQKSIPKFVRQLYVILIGIPLTRVIFDIPHFRQEKWVEILLALFVTFVVARYWWEWVAYLEETVRSTIIELLIDFAVLITMAFLFVYYRDPCKLAFTFAFLGLFDLAWVFNHVGWGSIQKSSKARIWMREKLAGLMIYICALCMIIVIREVAELWELAALVMFPAILVQWFCFREMRRKDALTFREAQVDDMPRLLAINRAYIDSSLSDAFLLEELPEDSESKLGSERPEKLFVLLREREILAYAQVSFTIDERALRSLTWLDPLFPSAIRKAKILYIDQVAVDPHNRGQGIGRHLYEQLMRRYPESLPCAFVSLQPRRNGSSLHFHTAMGFEKAAMFSRDEFLGQHDYQSLLFVHAAQMFKLVTALADGLTVGDSSEDAGVGLGTKALKSRSSRR